MRSTQMAWTGRCLYPSRTQMGWIGSVRIMNGRKCIPEGTNEQQMQNSDKCLSPSRTKLPVTSAGHNS
eukprot:534823-Amphidinium_carterae.1